VVGRLGLMTNTPGDGETPQDPSSGQQQPPYGQPPYGQPQYGQAQYDQPQYGQQPYGQVPSYPAQAPMQYAPDHPKSTTVLVLGILGLVACGIIAPFAWSMGRRTLAEIDASQGALGGRGAANAGYILGIIGTVILAVSLLVLAFVLVLAIVGATASTSF
jgi:hypothetical protein